MQEAEQVGEKGGDKGGFGRDTEVGSSPDRKGKNPTRREVQPHKHQLLHLHVEGGSVQSAGGTRRFSFITTVLYVHALGGYNESSYRSIEISTMTRVPACAQRERAPAIVIPRCQLPAMEESCEAPPISSRREVHRLPIRRRKGRKIHFKNSPVGSVPSLWQRCSVVGYSKSGQNARRSFE